MRSLLVVFSFHHNNTEKIAKVFAKVLDAKIKTPQHIKLEDLQRYDLIGFGSGIYDAQHHKHLLDLADRLPKVDKKKAFLFSTCGVTWEFPKFHIPLRKKLEAKGYLIVDEFTCPGFNTNSFIKYVGGINKGRPNNKDLKRAKEFARNLKKKIRWK